MKIFALILSLVASTPALAWGEREQGIVTGVAATLLLQRTQPYQYRQVVYPQPVYYYPQPVYHDYNYRPMYKFIDVYVPECDCYDSVKIRVY